MGTDLVKFMSNNQLSLQHESFTSRLERDYKSISAVGTVDYIVNLKERGFFSDDMDKILELFLLFRTLSIYQAAQLSVPQYTEDVHTYVSTIFAKLFYMHFIQPVDIEEKLIGIKSSYPLPSMTFILGPAGARYLASKHNMQMTELGWSKANLIGNMSYGLHNIIVTEIIIHASKLVKAMQIIPNMALGFEIESEWNGRIFPRSGPAKKVIARPDFTIRMKYQDETLKQPIQKTFLLEYDNGTENMDTLCHKLIDFQKAFTVGRLPMGTPATTYLVFVFNDSKRATKFSKAVINTIKENLSVLKMVYITTLDTIFPLGFITDQWMELDMNAMFLAQRATKNIANPDGDGEKITFYRKASVFPEAYEKFAQYKLGKAIEGAYEDNKLEDDKSHFLRIEFSVFNDLKSQYVTPATDETLDAHIEEPKVEDLASYLMDDEEEVA